MDEHKALVHVTPHHQIGTADKIFAQRKRPKARGDRQTASGEEIWAVGDLGAIQSLLPSDSSTTTELEEGATKLELEQLHFSSSLDMAGY
jgi:hypothetical protein